MPKRVAKKFKRVVCDEVQGEGSFVVFTAPNFEDISDFGDLIFGSGTVDNLPDSEAVKVVVPMLKKFVVSWNWVDDDDNPLPQPKEDPSVIDLLTIEEQSFLVENLTSSFNRPETTAKN